MARPRIFISSTFFDLRVVRADLERFIKEIGYDPVLFERGHIAYGKDDALEESCYREINSCDILIAIIGGKYGSQSKDQKNSITQKELKTAVELGKQIYVFVEKSVHSEYRTYQMNKDVPGFKPASVDDIKIFPLLEEIYSLPVGNPIEPFEVSGDIVHFLREQWAGLFQRLLQESARQKEVNIIENLKNTAETLNNLVTFLTQERSKGDEAIAEILLSTHPAFTAIKTIAGIPYRVAFHTLKELEALLPVRSFTKSKNPTTETCYEWNHDKEKYGIRVNKAIFDKNGGLKIYTAHNWDKGWIQKYDIVEKKPSAELMDDEIPF